MGKVLFCLFSFSIIISSYSALIRKAYFEEINAFFNDQDYDVFEEENVFPEVNTNLVVKAKGSNERILKGNNCDYIAICDIATNSQCSDGNKFVIKRANETRKQFLILDNKPVLGFISKGKKFTDCTEYTEITNDVTCKEVSGLSSVSLESSNETSSDVTLTIGEEESTTTTKTFNTTEPSESTTSLNTTAANIETSNSTMSVNGSASNSTLRSYEEILVINSEAEIKTKTAEGRIFRGEHCEFISICEITENSGCSNGWKHYYK